MDGFFEVEPAWFGVDGGGFVFFEDWCHFLGFDIDFDSIRVELGWVELS